MTSYDFEKAAKNAVISVLDESNIGEGHWRVIGANSILIKTIL